MCTCGHDKDHIFPRECSIDCGQLKRSKRVDFESRFQHGAEFV